MRVDLLRTLLFCGVFASLVLPAPGQIRINEVGYDDVEFEEAAKWVELYNASSEAIDVSALMLCSFPNYTPIGDLTVLAGATTIESGGLLVVAWEAIGEGDGEVGLYAEGTTNFADPNQIRDYMHYGANTHERLSVAVSAGIWTEGTVVTPAGEGMSLSRVGSGSVTADNWLATAPSPGEANATLYRAVLSGGNEAPAVPSRATGEVEALLDGTTLMVSGSFEGLESDFNADAGGGAHIHAGLAGQNGGVTFPLTTVVGEDNRSGTYEAADNTFELDEEQLATLEARGFYVNIHSIDYPGGEIRGQLLVGMAMKAVLAGSNEVPANLSQGTGGVVAEIVDGRLVVSGAFRDLASDFNPAIGGGAHIHAAPAGRNGGVTFPLTSTVGEDNRSGTFAAADNAFELDEDQFTRLSQRGFYVNIHSVDHPGGEIRGQLIGLGSTPFTAGLSSANEAPARAGRGSGGAVAELSGTTLTVSGAFSNLGSDFNAAIGGGAHIHTGLAGQNGGVTFPLMTAVGDESRSGTFAAADNTFELTDEQIDLLLARSFYVNIHSLSHPSGEIRGQLLPTSSVPLRAVLSGRAEVDPNTSQAAGGTAVELYGSNLILSGAFSGLESDFNAEVGGGAHLHGGTLGVNAGVAFPLTTTVGEDNRSGTFAAADNTIELEEADVETLLSGGYYVNIHSIDHSGGEIRGQVWPVTYYAFEANLASANEVPAPDTLSAATGGVLAVLMDTVLVVSGAFSGLESDFNAEIGGGAHLHLAAANASGGVAFPLSATLGEDNRSGSFVPAQNTITLTPADVDSLYAGKYYVNIHSVDRSSGEIRGQLLPSTNLAPSPSITTPEDGATVTIMGEPEDPFVVEWNGGDPNGPPVFYSWQLATDDTFSTVLLEAATGTQTRFETTLEAVEGILEEAGVEPDQSITLYHRAIGSDGSFIGTGSAEVTLTRGIVEVGVEDEDGVPRSFVLHGNYPNPFNPSTTVRFDLPDVARVQVEIHDLLGRRVRSIPFGTMAAGANQTVLIDAGTLASGVYLYRVIAETTAETFTRTGRMVLIK